MIVDLQTQDVANLAADFTAFETQYDHIRTAILPEWSALMPTEPVDALGVALMSGDPSAVGQALGTVGAVCGNCHGRFQMKVQAKYHWANFDDKVGFDPVSTSSIAWTDFMGNTAIAFNAISHELGQGQLAEARTAFTTFSSYFDSLGQACSQCHTTPREYFVDASARAVVDAIGAELQQTTPNPATVGQLIGQVGMETCLSCHFVHQPGAMVREFFGIH